MALNSSRYFHTHNHFVLHVKTSLPKEIIHNRIQDVFIDAADFLHDKSGGRILPTSITIRIKTINNVFKEQQE